MRDCSGRILTASERSGSIPGGAKLQGLRDAMSASALAALLIVVDLAPPIREAISVDFTRVRVEELHDYLRCSEERLSFLRAAAADDIFVRHQIPKRGRGNVREVWEVRDSDLVVMYSTLSRSLDEFFRSHLNAFPHPAAHAYVRRRSTLTNASKHLGVPVLVKADIRGFFRRINGERVEALLRAAGVPKEAASVLRSILVWEDQIPLGLHTSPVLANAVCVDLDEALATLAAGGCYTRYADDLTFSGPVLPSKDQVADVLGRHGFEIAEEKWRICRRGRGLWVTGLSLEDGRAPRVPKHLKRRIRQELHYIERFGIDDHIARHGYGSRQSGLNKISGTIRYINGIEAKTGQRLQDRWSQLAEQQGFTTELIASGPATGRQALFLVDESVAEGPHGQVMLLALVIIEDLDSARNRLSALLAKLLTASDPATPVETLRKEGLHWNKLALDDRKGAVEVLRGIPFRAFVAYQRLASQEKHDYATTYNRLLRKLLEKRLVRFAGATVTLKLEENSKIKRTVPERAINDIYADLGSVGSRRPLLPPTTEVVSKRNDDALPLPDFVLSVVAEYAQVNLKAASVAQRKEKQLPGAQAERRFRQIEGKVKAVFDLDTGQVFSRRIPFRPW
jgi:RNA-directed DNA polymerase